MNNKGIKYGIIENKKAKLDYLANKVFQAEGNVKELEAIVASLTEKSNKLKTQLSSAIEGKSKALKNKNLGEKVIAKTEELKELYELEFAKVKAVNNVVNSSYKVEGLIKKLIYTVEIINKLSNLVIRKKASNQLIPDELVAIITKAGTDANNAVALTLTALDSIFASQSTILESETTLRLGSRQVSSLHSYLKEERSINVIKEDKVDKRARFCLWKLLQTADNVAIQIYNNLLAAEQDTEKQLQNAKSKLSKANINLASLKSGLAAAKAAAFA